MPAVAVCQKHIVLHVLGCPVLLQLYRVNVLLQSPDALDLSSKPPFFVLRRYSQFRQLHAEVRHTAAAADCGASFAIQMSSSTECSSTVAAVQVLTASVCPRNRWRPGSSFIGAAATVLIASFAHTELLHNCCLHRPANVTVQLKAQFPEVFKAPELAVPPKHTLAALGGQAQHKELLDR
jgi:hypothetical protein